MNPQRLHSSVVLRSAGVVAVPVRVVAEVWAAKQRANRSGSPGSNLHLGVCIAVYLVALGIPNRVCWSVVLEILTSTINHSRTDSG